MTLTLGIAGMCKRALNAARTGNQATSEHAPELNSVTRNFLVFDIDQAFRDGFAFDAYRNKYRTVTRSRDLFIVGREGKEYCFYRSGKPYSKETHKMIAFPEKEQTFTRHIIAYNPDTMVTYGGLDVGFNSGAYLFEKKMIEQGRPVKVITNTRLPCHHETLKALGLGKYIRTNE